ncbi:hypothetical protein vseg_013249 [Gypsophila vaccaria]
MAESIITNLVQQLGLLALEEAKSVKEVEGQCSSLVNELKIMKSFLRDSEGRGTDHDAVKKLLEQIREVAFQAEDVIETFVLETQRHQRRTKTERIVHKLGHWQSLRTIGKQIDSINQRIKKIYEDKEKFQIEMGEGSRNTHFENLLRRQRMEVDEEVVGFNDVVDTLQKQLIEGSSQLEVMSIVGMGGLGKTTVAKKLYNDDKIIRNHFNCIGWVFVSDQDYKTREVILNLFKSLGKKMDVFEPMETEELKKILCKHLMGHRYLIILDDVWNKKMWDEVKECFPDKYNGSRIVITSRIAEVARYASPKEPHFLRFLHPEESWSLFCKRVFRGDPCPSHLEPIGRQISTRCKGLPLSIVVLGSMLATKEKTERVWEGMINYVSSFIGEDKTCLQVLALSYHHLPSMLKPCFLYFGAFPEDYEMSVRRLIAVWLAEGLVSPIGNRPLEDVAESYLEELINRSLVQVGKKRTDGGLKTCRIHDLLRDLCIEEGTRENFLTANMEAPKSASPSFSQRKHRRVSSLRYTPQLIKSKDWASSSLRALFSFDPQRNSMSLHSWKSLCNKYSLIRILDRGDNITAGSIPSALSELTNLRYLRLFISTSIIPSSIFELWNLKILFIHGSPSYVLPFELFKLQQLEQLILRGRAAFMPNSVRSSTRPLLSLRVMSSIVHNEAFDSLVKNLYFPNLIKLGIDGSQCKWPYFINLLPFLPCMERLTLSHLESARRDDDDIFEGVMEAHILTSNLKKVSLKSSSWSGRSIELLGKFPQLQILKLREVELYVRPDNWFDRICVSENFFPKLHTFHMDNVCCLRGVYLLHETALLQLRSLFIAGNNSYKSMECAPLGALPNLQDVKIINSPWRWAYRTEVELSEDEDEVEAKFRFLIHYHCTNNIGNGT